MNQQMKLAAKYVQNTNGGATKAHFTEDFEPVGEMLWDDLSRNEYVEERDGKIYLTDLGEAALSST